MRIAVFSCPTFKIKNTHRKSSFCEVKALYEFAVLLTVHKLQQLSEFNSFPQLKEPPSAEKVR